MAFQRAYGSHCWLKAWHIVFGTPVQFYTVRGKPSKIRRYAVRRGGGGYSLSNGKMENNLSEMIVLNTPCRNASA